MFKLRLELELKLLSFTMSCFKYKSMFVFNMGYFFRIWAKTRLTFKYCWKNDIIGKF